jgi:hypothetical protein
MIVNSDNGGMAVFSLLRSQQVVAPSEFLTDGRYLDVGVDVTRIMTVVSRVFDGTTRYFVEEFDNTLFTDCAFTGAAASGATGLPHEGKTLDVVCDGAVQDQEVVTSGGITFQRPSTTYYEVGLPMTVYAKTMPIEARLRTGPRLAFKKRLVQINAIVEDTQHLNINNQFVPFRNFDNPLLDDPVPEFTGIKRLDGVRGYSREIAIEVTQTLPLKMVLLGLEYKLSIYQGQ